jgi:hypothetical protein
MFYLLPQNRTSRRPKPEEISFFVQKTVHKNATKLALNASIRYKGGIDSV